jgi:hypothetical protein
MQRVGLPLAVLGLVNAKGRAPISCAQLSECEGLGSYWRAWRSEWERMGHPLAVPSLMDAKGRAPIG